MPQKPSKSFSLSLLFVLVLVLVVSVSAIHSSNEQSHARRSLEKKRQSGGGALGPGNVAKRAGRRQLDLDLGDLGLPALTSILGPTSIVPSSTASSSSNQATSDSASSSPGSTSANSDSSSATSSDSSSATSDSSSASTAASDSSTTPTSSSSEGGILDPITSLLGGGQTSTTSESGTSPTSTVTGAPTSDAPTGTSDAPNSTSDAATTTSSEESNTTPPPATTSSSEDGGILSGILSGLSSVVNPPPTSTEESTTAQPTTEQTTAASEQPTNPPSSTQEPTSAPTEPPTSTTSGDGGILSTLMSDLSSAVNPPTSEPTSEASTTPTDAPTSQGSSTPTDAPTSTDTSASATITDPPVSSSSSSGGIIDTLTSVVSSVLDPPSSSSGSVSISITDGPSGSSSASDSGPTSVSGTGSGSSELVFTSISSPSAQSLSDPDQATTTFSSAAASGATFTAAPLPPTLPTRIYPANGVQDGTKMAGYTLITLLFNQELNWPFVAGSQKSSSQIFALMPVIINNALGLSGARAQQTYLLQVHVPSSYAGPKDQASLGTLYLTYIPTDEVDNLAAMIQARNSAFYTGVQNPVAKELALRVDAGYSVVGVPDPNGGDGGNSNGNGGANSGGSADRTRQDAIIGVVASLGGIALLVLAFLGYRWYKRTQEQKHRRLSDPVGVRPDGREFDQDSVGGQRRRSFYFAEDSLRGYSDAPGPSGQGQAGEFGYSAFSQSQHPGGMTQRRPVVPGAISQPVLQQSSMNW
ncbi:hypothetical protein AAF712_015513 [Marasmius tenuissimus]|uniref:Uncharacterized protein n=1 Tax=Marasmius tenuissimus TaxID=585030 RepID=A0ABR2Z972_9AGAR